MQLRGVVCSVNGLHRCEQSRAAADEVSEDEFEAGVVVFCHDVQRLGVASQPAARRFDVE